MNPPEPEKLTTMATLLAVLCSSDVPNLSMKLKSHNFEDRPAATGDHGARLCYQMDLFSLTLPGWRNRGQQADCCSTTLGETEKATSHSLSSRESNPLSNFSRLGEVLHFALHWRQSFHPSNIEPRCVICPLFGCSWLSYRLHELLSLLLHLLSIWRRGETQLFRVQEC
jgi:hypothetical protein